MLDVPLAYAKKSVPLDMLIVMLRWSAGSCVGADNESDAGDEPKERDVPVQVTVLAFS